MDAPEPTPNAYPRMRTPPTQRAGDALKVLLATTPLGQRLKEHDLLTNWQQVVGPALAAHVERLWFKDGVVYLTLDHPMWREECRYNAQELVAAFNAHAGSQLVTAVQVL